jgi:hypothetical protein
MRWLTRLVHGWRGRAEGEAVSRLQRADQQNARAHFDLQRSALDGAVDAADVHTTLETIRAISARSASRVRETREGR